jgi:hypothetical protein
LRADQLVGGDGDEPRRYVGVEAGDRDVAPRCSAFGEARFDENLRWAWAINPNIGDVIAKRTIGPCGERTCVVEFDLKEAPNA